MKNNSQSVIFSRYSPALPADYTSGMTDESKSSRTVWAIILAGMAVYFGIGALDGNTQRAVLSGFMAASSLIGTCFMFNRRKSG